MFYVEVTDTYGEEANYAWVKHFMVKAKTFTGAIRKVSKEMGYSFSCEGDFGDSRRYKAKDACVCAFVAEADEICVNQMKGNAKEL